MRNEGVNETVHANIDSADGAMALARWRTQWCEEIVGEDQRLLEALDVIRRVADTDCGVLITGESGTGKELLARAVHDASGRRKAPFVALNCAAIPETMIEAELFGHVRGSFTGATATRTGKIAAAAGGTLFLDEIGDMPLAAQAKLLRLLQERTICPVGSDREIAIDVRVVAATNKDLSKMASEGTFRADLYYRLSVVPVHLPALRERKSDIPKLAKSLLERANTRNRRQVAAFSEACLRAMSISEWPGNIRQLGHAIERAVVLKGHGVLEPGDLGLRTRFAEGTIPGTKMTPLTRENLDLRSALCEVEKTLIAQALEQTGGNRTEAAALLGLNRTTLVEKLRKYAAH